MSEYRFCPQCARPLARVLFDGRTRSRCEAEGCGFVHYVNPLPVAAAIVELPAGVVLARAKNWPSKMFGLITGFLEEGETGEEGAVREVREEVGLEATVVSLVGVYPMKERNEVLLAYHLRADGEVKLGEELEEYRVVPVEKLRPWGFGTGLAVEEWLRRRSATAR